MSGSVQMTAVIFINSEIHIPREDTTKEPYWTRPITHAELATVCRCTVRAVEIKLKDLMERKVVEGKRTSSGFRYHIPFEKWHELPDMVAVEEIPSQPAPVDEIPDSEISKRQYRMPQPQSLRAGQKSRPIELGGCAPGKASVRTKLPITYDIEVVDGVAIFNVLHGEQIEKREEKAKPNRSKGRFATPQSVDTPQKQLSDFHLFESAWLENKINAAPDDWVVSRAEWGKLSPEDRTAAVAGIRERFYLGEYDARDPKWIPLPQNYLKGRKWLRPIRGAQANKSKTFKDAATVQKSLAWAEEQDRKIKAGGR